MTDAAAEAKRVYMRKWRAENKDKVKVHQQRYWERKAAELTKEGGGDNGKRDGTNRPSNCAESES